jgi:hypothetical protein
MYKFKVNNNWIEPIKILHNSELLSFSMKLSEIVIIETKKGDKYDNYSYGIHLFTSNSQILIIGYNDTEFEIFEKDLLELKNLLYNF